jgi:hypothetical protein
VPKGTTVIFYDDLDWRRMSQPTARVFCGDRGEVAPGTTSLLEDECMIDCA